jgi:hypothetical protein
MLSGFLFWFLGSLGMLENTPGGMVFAWLIVLAAGLAAFFRWPDRPPVRAWFAENRALIIATEVLFALLLFGWAAFRAHNPEMNTTEKPMEVMFINSIRASDTFPRRAAGRYAISATYFGYLIIAALADLGGMGSGVACPGDRADSRRPIAHGINMVRARAALPGWERFGGAGGGRVGDAFPDPDKQWARHW